ncbi:DUF7144 family membrane protein [Streptacidiphilus rugosus]|uniref:DUF7144 family membrane protein n=1 Tax=Streptacidiphilus rugosus TaxID=405783 RepID=UPI0007C79172|nr:hypothetical protein [Streptacidiphilus rugosus]
MASQTSPTAYQPRSAARAPAQSERSGMVTFAAVMLFILAFFNGLNGISAINNARVFTGNTVLIVGDLRAWGWTLLALGIAQALAGAAVLRGGQVGRWFGVTVLGVNAFAQMWFVSAYPIWSLTIIALDVVAIYGLCAFGGPPGSREARDQ